MNYFFLKLVYLQVICLSLGTCGKVKIIDGKTVNIEDYPYQVSVQYFDEHFCGGSIISNNFIATAAHCTNKKTIYSLNVRVGTSFRDQDGQIVYLKKIHQHPQFNDKYDYDISILELEKPLQFSSTIQLVNLADMNQEVTPGTNAIITGWGVIHPHDTEFSTQLRVAKIPVISLDECKNDYGEEISENMICAGYSEGGIDACHGDSGGPLVINDTLTGIISWGIGCARRGYPGVYASIPSLRSFIDEILSSNK